MSGQPNQNDQNQPLCLTDAIRNLLMQFDMLSAETESASNVVANAGLQNTQLARDVDVLKVGLENLRSGVYDNLSGHHATLAAANLPVSSNSYQHPVAIDQYIDPLLLQGSQPVKNQYVAPNAFLPPQNIGQNAGQFDMFQIDQSQNVQAPNAQNPAPQQENIGQNVSQFGMFQIDQNPEASNGTAQLRRGNRFGASQTEYTEDEDRFIATEFTKVIEAAQQSGLKLNKAAAARVIAAQFSQTFGREVSNQSVATRWWRMSTGYKNASLPDASGDDEVDE